MTNKNILIINQLFEIQHKLKEQQLLAGFERNFNRLSSIFEEDGYVIQDPTNESYIESRTDCEASIVGALSTRMKIVKTLKPIIYQKVDNSLQLVQKAIVIVE